jgi:hypothetical protein
VTPFSCSYALENGTIGVYCGEKRLWRMKSKMIPVCIDVMDVNDNGSLEVLSAWTGGKVSKMIPYFGLINHRVVG